MSTRNKDLALLKRCLDVLNMEAQASDNWKRPADKCPSWYELRAELRDRLKALSPNTELTDRRGAGSVK